MAKSACNSTVSRSGSSKVKDEMDAGFQRVVNGNHWNVEQAGPDKISGRGENLPVLAVVPRFHRGERLYPHVELNFQVRGKRAA